MTPMRPLPLSPSAIGGESPSLERARRRSARRSTAARPSRRLEQRFADGAVQHDAVGRQGRRRSARRVHERQDVVPCGVALAGAVPATLLAVAQGRLVAVVAIRDRHGRGREGREQRRPSVASPLAGAAVRSVRSPLSSRPWSRVGRTQASCARRRGRRSRRALARSARQAFIDATAAAFAALPSSSAASTTMGSCSARSPSATRSGPPWGRRACARVAARPSPGRTARCGAARGRRSRSPGRPPASSRSSDGA